MATKGPTTKRGKRAKMQKVLHEFKAEALHSSSGKKVTNPKQALAIALSESGQAKPTRSRRPASRRSTPDMVVVHRS